jgi:O-antigen/teichoic acid export membrane protein
MILVMGVSLFTSRIVLQELGISDFGVYTVVGGFISLFAFLNIAMSAATQRYLTFDIGKKDFKALKKTFSATLTIHIGIAVLILLLAETVGLWYVNNKMVIPTERLVAANIVYQFSIAASLLSIIQVPYNSLIIAHEKMSVYAYVSILEVSLKLLIVFLLVFLGSDKLITYAILTFVVSFIIRIIYQMYCRKNFPESKYSFQWDWVYYKELIAYSGWNLFGNLAVVAKVQGSNLLLNLFFGTAVNAAYGIMATVNSAVNNLVSNFQVATNPQIIKSFASGENRTVEKLMNQATKFTYYLSLLLIAPLILNIDFILKLWLVNPPPHSAHFILIILICSLVDVLSKSIMTGITATGRIKTYHIVIGFFNSLIIPIAYILYKFEYSTNPNLIMYIWLFFSVISFGFRLLFVKRLMDYDIKLFLAKVLIPVFRITIIALLIGIGIKHLFQQINFSIFIIETFALCTLLGIIIFQFGMESNEKKLVLRAKDKIISKFIYKR